MVNKLFIEESDRLISLFKDRQIAVDNCNLVVAKVKAEEITAGGLVIPKKATELKDYHSGLARIIAVASNADAHYKSGDYIIHSHEARYKPHEEALREFLGYLVEENLVYTLSDNNVIMRIGQEVMHGN